MGPATLESKEVPPAPAPAPVPPDQLPHVPEVPDGDFDMAVLDKAGPGVRSKRTPHRTMERKFESRGFQAAGPVMNDDGVQHSPQLSSYWCSPPFVAAPDNDPLDSPDHFRGPRTARPPKRSALKKPRDDDDEAEPHKRPVSPAAVAAGDLHPLDDCGLEFETQASPTDAASELLERAEKGVQATPHVHHVGVGRGDERELRSCASATDEVSTADFGAGVQLPYSMPPPPSYSWQAREFPPGMPRGEQTPVVDERVRTPPHKSPSEPQEWLLEPLDERAHPLLVPQSTQEPERCVEQSAQTDPLLYRRDVVMQTGAQRAVVDWELLDWSLELFDRWQTSPAPRDLYCILFTTPGELIAPAERSPDEPLPAAEHKAVQTDTPVECADACEGPTPEHRHSACVQTGLEVDFGERFFEPPEQRPSMAIAEPYERLPQWPPPPTRTVAIQRTLLEQAVGVQTDELLRVCDLLMQAGPPFDSHSSLLPPDMYATVEPGEPFELIPPLKAKRTQKAHKATQTGEQIECQDASCRTASVAQRHVCLATQADSLFDFKRPVSSNGDGDELVRTELVPLLTAAPTLTHSNFRCSLVFACGPSGARAPATSSRRRSP